LVEGLLLRLLHFFLVLKHLDLPLVLAVIWLLFYFCGVLELAVDPAEEQRLAALLSLELEAGSLPAVRVRQKGVAGEKILLRVIAEDARDLAELEQQLERGLCEESGCNAHRRGERGRADALALDAALTQLCDGERDGAAKAGRLTRDDQLNVRAHRILRYAGLQPDLVRLVAELVYSHPCRVVVHA